MSAPLFFKRGNYKTKTMGVFLERDLAGNDARHNEVQTGKYILALLCSRKSR